MTENLTYTNFDRKYNTDLNIKFYIVVYSNNMLRSVITYYYLFSLHSYQTLKLQILYFLNGVINPPAGGTASGVGRSTAKHYELNSSFMNYLDSIQNRSYSP